MRQRGFTLLELMIVVALIGVILAIAIPSYQESTRRTRRAQAQGCLAERAQFLERYYTTNLRYVDGTGAAPTMPGCSTDVTAFYRFTNGTIAASTFLLRAAPLDGQAQDACGTMTLNQAGIKTAANTTCWR